MVEGVQFHPESILSPDGPQLLRQFPESERAARATAWAPRGPTMLPLRKALEHLLGGQHLSQAEAAALLTQLTAADTHPAVTGAVLAALRAKGVVAEELRGFADGMRALALRPKIPAGTRAIDIVGTGGDASGSLSISTGTALLTAACGLPVVKHGNRSISSKCGSGDVLEALGVKIPMDEVAAGRCLAATGFTFLFAPYYHPAMKAVAQARAALGVRTIFNILGPLTNPASPPLYVIGAYSPQVARLMADAVSGMPIERAFVVHGSHGWDEPTPVGPFMLFDVRPGSGDRTGSRSAGLRSGALPERGPRRRRRRAQRACAACGAERRG